MLAKKLAVLAALLFAAGCRCGSTCGDTSYGSAYGDADYGIAPDSQVAAMPTQEKAFVDRHPILSAPRNYYRDSGDNVVVKVLAGTVVGVPVGVAQEVWQIGYGQ
jgi:hypothetical protein